MIIAAQSGTKAAALLSLPHVCGLVTRGADASGAG